MMSETHGGTVYVSSYSQVHPPPLLISPSAGPPPPPPHEPDPVQGFSLLEELLLVGGLEAPREGLDCSRRRRRNSWMN